jgi:hypothetical protein
MDRREHLTRQYRDHGGSGEPMDEVERFVTRRHDALNSCHRVMSQRLHRREPSLTAAGDPVVTGVIDFEGILRRSHG